MDIQSVAHIRPVEITTCSFKIILYQKKRRKKNRSIIVKNEINLDWNIFLFSIFLMYIIIVGFLTEKSQSTLGQTLRF